MKKLLAVLLVILMVLPLGMTASAEEDVGIKPFYFVQYQQQYPEYYELSDLYYYSPYFYTPVNALHDYVVSYEGARDIPSIAEKLKEVFNNQPKGTRYVTFSLPAVAIQNLCEHVIYTDNATEVIKNWFEPFIEEYHRIGGEVDGFILDLEYASSEGYYIYEREYKQDNTLFKKIVEHPQYQTKVRPLLEERGFKFYEDESGMLTEIWSITMASGEYARCREIWDVAIRNMINNDVSKAVYEPLAKYYPEAIVADYQAKNTYNWLKTASDYGGTGINYGGNFQALGNSSNYNTYSVRPTLNYYTDLKTNIPTYNVPHGYYKAVYENSPFHMFLWESNIFKDLYAAKGEDSISMWICGYDYNKENPNSASNTPYYAETVLHMGMLDPQPLLGWITLATHDDDEERYQYALKVADDIVVELTRVLGAADRKPILVPTTWNDSFVLSGMYAGGKNIWRVTPDITQVSKEDFKVEGSDPTFSVNGKTITFPQGKIIEDGNVTEVGTCGYWVETPTDVTPVITNSSNYYKENPSFQETFEDYKPDTDYNFDNSLPVYAWEFKKSKDSAATVVVDKNNPDNQVLALTGNFTVRNVRLPQNITAGDSYAENQMWEITVTLPENMGADAEVVLLNCVGQKKKSDDLGIKIAGGKLYYDKAGEYQELAGVDLSAGGTYTIRREVDFNNAEALTSDYSILDATGKVLGQVKNVPMVSLVLPMTSIHFGVSNVTGEAVTVDNYRLYPTGVATDFELYDADLGLVIEDTTKARAEDTAYRLSWMNATDKEKTYTVVAAYYDGETKVSEKVLQEIKMAPGTDGIETAIVKNESEGQTMLVYLRNDNPAEPDDDPVSGTEPNATNPTGEPGDKGDEDKGDNSLIVIIAVAAVVLVAAAVVIILLTKKKKNNTDTAAE